MWAPGTKVEAIYDKRDGGFRAGDRFTVLKSAPFDDLCFSVWFIDLPTPPGWEYLGWDSTRFRPIVEKKLPECLTELLKTPKRESEPA